MTALRALPLKDYLGNLDIDSLWKMCNKCCIKLNLNGQRALRPASFFEAPPPKAYN